MLYPRCPTCGTVLSNKQLPYEKEMAKICSSNMSEREIRDAKMQLLDDLQLKNYCCRMRMLGYVSLIQIIK